MNKAQLTLDLSKDLKQVAETLEAFAQVLMETSSSIVNTKEYEITEEKGSDIQTAVSIEQVRAILAEKSQSGLTTKVKELLECFGANKLSAVNVTDFPKLLEAAKKI